MKSILDPSFKYTPSNSTDIRQTFARERERLAKEKAAREACVVTLTPEKVEELRKTFDGAKPGRLRVLA